MEEANSLMEAVTEQRKKVAAPANVDAIIADDQGQRVSASEIDPPHQLLHVYVSPI